MSKELFWLAMTVALTGLAWVPYILDRMMVRGMMGTLANPSPSDAPQTAWAQRMMASHTNAVENLVVFAPLVLAAEALGLGGGITLAASVVYFVARLAHFVVYTAGLPVVRTLAFTAAWLAQAAVALVILRVVL